MALHSHFSDEFWNHGETANQAGQQNVHGNLNIYQTQQIGRPETPPQPSNRIPFRRDPDFVDHGTILDQLDQVLALPASWAALVGLGGVGKSLLAIEYVYRFQEQFPESWIFWVYAGSFARFEQSYLEIADHVKIPGRTNPQANKTKLVSDWLCDRRNGKWLLILDNADDVGLLSETGRDKQGVRTICSEDKGAHSLSAYIPQSQNGRVLITTRNEDVASRLVDQREIIQLEPMAESNALKLLEKKLGKWVDAENMVELAKTLEYMPLAIVQAAANISQKAPRYSVRQYLEEIRKSERQKTSLLDFKGGHLRRDREAKNSIILTWQIAFDYIRQRRPSAADLLSLMSFFDRQGIPEALIRNRDLCSRRNRPGHGGSTTDEDHEEDKNEDDQRSASVFSEDDGFEDDVQILRDFSFISAETPETFAMHALVQLATRKWLEASEQLEKWKRLFIQNLSAEFPTGKYENWPRCQALFPHVKLAMIQRPRIDEALRAWASLMYRAAWYAEEKGNIADAIQLSTKAIDVRKRVLGQRHIETLSAIAIMSQAYRSGGRYREAEELGVLVLKITKDVLGEKHPGTLTSINNLALIYEFQGRWKEAEELGVQVLQLKKDVIGEKHLGTLVSMNNLSETYYDQGRWEEAEELEIKVLETCKDVLREKHPYTLSSMNNLACIWKGQGRNTEAKDMMKKCVELSTEVIGADHLNTVKSSQSLTEWQNQNLQIDSPALEHSTTEEEPA